MTLWADETSRHYTDRDIRRDFGEIDDTGITTTIDLLRYCCFPRGQPGDFVDVGAIDADVVQLTV
jgi:hypothetical protein